MFISNILELLGMSGPGWVWFILLLFIHVSTDLKMLNLLIFSWKPCFTK